VPVWQVGERLIMWQGNTNLIFFNPLFPRGSGSIVGVATGCGLYGPGIESRWGLDFRHLSRPALGPSQPPVQWVPGLSRV